MLWLIFCIDVIADPEQVLYQETDTFNSTSKVFFTNPDNTYAGKIDFANGTTTSTYSEVSGFATNANTAGFATNANSANISGFATSATTSATSTNSLYAGTANIALFANGAQTANWSAVSALASNLVGGIPSSVTSVYTRALIDDSDVIIISNRVVYNSSGVKIADLDKFIIYSNNVLSTDFDARLLYNYGGVVVYNWDTGKFYDTAGGVNILDLFAGILRKPTGSGAGSISLDFSERLLYRSTGDASIDWNTLYLHGPWRIDTTADEDGEIVDYTLLTNFYYFITDEYTSAIDIAINTHSNWVSVGTNILDLKIDGVSNYVVGITNEYVRTNHTLTINGNVGNFDSNLIYTIDGGGATESTTNYIDAGNLAGSNYIESASLATTNYIIGITNDFQNQILSQSNRINGVSNYVVGITNQYVRTNHTLTINGAVGNFDSNLSYTIVGGALLSTTNYIDAGNLANSNHTIQATNDLFQTITNSLDVRLMQVTNLTVRSGATIVGNTLITNGSLRVYSSSGSGVPDLQIGRFDNALGFGFNAKNEGTQPIANNPWFRIAGGANDGLVLNPGNDDAFLIFGNDKRATIALGSGASKVGVNTLSPVSGFAFDVAGSANIRTNLYVTNSIVLANNGALRIKEAGTGNELVVIQKASDNVIRTYSTVRYDVINAGTPSKTNASFDIANERTTLLGPLRIGGAHVGTISETSELQVQGVSTPAIVLGVNGADKGTNGIVFSHNGGIGNYYSRKKNGIFSRYNGTGWSRGDLHFVLNNEGNANDYDFFPDTRMIIRSSGDTCIGDTNTVSGSKLTVSGDTTIKGNLTITNNVLGSRELLTFGKTSGSTTNFYAGYAALTSSTNASVISIRDGSVIGMSTRFNVTAQTTAGDVWCEVWIEDVVALSNKVSVSGTGWYNGFTTTNRNVYPFVAGKPLTVFHRYVGFAGTIGNCYDAIEIMVND